MDPRHDGRAVAAARARLAEAAVPGQEGWRSTVVAASGSGWLVRTWTMTPALASRPTGSPDYVHHVELDEEGQPLQIHQVHPSNA